MAAAKPSKDDQNALLAAVAGKQEEIKQGAQQTLGQVVPILAIDIRPTNVDPADPAGIGNMKRVLSAILNDEGNKVTVKDEVGKSVGVRNFNEIYPNVVGPAADGSIQVEYHEQATLGFVGDLMWSFQWFFKRGILGVPRQMVGAVLQQCGVSFVLETYYKQWLASIIDHLNQRGVIPGFTDQATGKDNWEITTQGVGRRMMLRPIAKK